MAASKSLKIVSASRPATAAGLSSARSGRGAQPNDSVINRRFSSRTASRFCGFSTATKIRFAGPPPLPDHSPATGMLAPLERREGGENPYAVHADLIAAMQELVGIIRTKSELEEAITRIHAMRERARRAGVTGSRIYNPGWHLALDLLTMLTVSEAVAMSALARRWFTAAEADWVAAQPVDGRTRCFLTLWTGKEARVQ